MFGTGIPASVGKTMPACTEPAIAITSNVEVVCPEAAWHSHPNPVVLVAADVIRDVTRDVILVATQDAPLVAAKSRGFSTSVDASESPLKNFPSSRPKSVQESARGCRYYLYHGLGGWNDRCHRSSFEGHVEAGRASTWPSFVRYQQLRLENSSG